MSTPAPKFHVSAASPSLIDRARVLYGVYADNAHNLNYQGLQCPPWEGLGESVQSHWCAVAGGHAVDEPTWRNTAENLRETVARLTAERDELRRQLTVVRSALALVTVAIADDPDEGGQRK